MLPRTLLFLFLIAPTSGHTQTVSEPRRNAGPPAYTHSLGVNFPTYVQLAEYQGIGMGFEYQRLLRPDGKLSASLSFTRLFWAGTQETKEYFASGHRADIGATLLGPGLYYHPFGRSHHVSLELGGTLLLGQIRRVDLYRPQRSSGDVARIMERSFFVAPQAHAGITFQARGLYLFSLYAEFGPVLTAGDTRGNYGTVGMRFGSGL